MTLVVGAGVLMLSPAALAQASGGLDSVQEPIVRTQMREAPIEEADAPDAEAPETGDEAGEGDGEGEGVTVSDYMTVDIFVQDEDLATVLQMLSMQSQRNIVASRDVVATVTANLYGVTFYEALDAILHVNGYGYIERGNFIYVYPAEVIQQMQAEQRQVVSKVIQLDYLNANDAAEFVAPLLSPDVGQIKTNGDAGQFTIGDKTPSGGEEFALSSTLVIYDYPENVEEIEALLEQLDTRPAQVLVEATILQMRLTEDNAFGIDFSVITDLDFDAFDGLGGPLGVVDSLFNSDDETGLATNKSNAVQSTPGNTEGPATLKVGVINDNFSIFLRVLDEVSDTTVLSSPKILTLNRQPARVLVGRKIGYLSTTTTETSTSQTVEFLDTGTQLAFRPFISTDGMIRMELAPSVSEGFIRDSTDATGASVTIPDEVTQEMTTNVMVRDGSTVVLGGLFREQTSLERSQVPVFGDIPLIGAAFRGHEDTTDRSEIIFMIRPTIVNDQVLTEQADRAYDYVERVRTGSRQGLLPWSRERQTAQLNVQAERLARDGKLDRAMWALRRSLELNPVQPDALELRERLFDLQDKWPSRNMLEQIIEGQEDIYFEGWKVPEEPGDEAMGAAPNSTSSDPQMGDSGTWMANPWMTKGAGAEASGIPSAEGEFDQAGESGPEISDAATMGSDVTETNASETGTETRPGMTPGDGAQTGVAEVESAEVSASEGAERQPTEFEGASWPWLVMPFATAPTNRPAPPAPGMAEAEQGFSEENVDYVETTSEGDEAVANVEDDEEE